MAYDMHKLEGMQAAVVLYRNMKDTIRAQYAFHHGNGAFLEAPLRAYYGESFAFSLSLYISMVSCQKGPTRHAYAWQIGPFWQETLDMWFVMSSPI